MFVLEMCNCGARRRAAMAAGGGCVGPGCTRSVPVAVPVAVPVPVPVPVAGRSVVAPAPAPSPAAQPPKTMTVMRRVRGRLVRVTIPVPAVAVVAPVPVPVAVVEPVDAGPDLTDSGLETVDPAIWGPPLWRFLHGAAAASSADASVATRWASVLEAMKTGLPCQECTDHYRTWFAAHPIADGSVSAWLLALHNDVNRRRGIPEWSAEQLAAAYPVAAAAAAAAAGLPEGLGPGLVAALRAI